MPVLFSHGISMIFCMTYDHRFWIEVKKFRCEKWSRGLGFWPHAELIQRCILVFSSCCTTSFLLRCFFKWDVSEALVCHACLRRILVQEAHESMLLGGYRHCIMYWLITSCSTSGLGFADGDCVVDLVSGLTMSGNKRCYVTQICVFLAAILDKCCHVYGHSWKL